MLTNQFVNRGSEYLMSLYLNDKGTFNVTIKLVTLKTDKYIKTDTVEEHEYVSYSEACKKFRSVFRWNHGLEPSLPLTYDFYKTNTVVPCRRVSR